MELVDLKSVWQDVVQEAINKEPIDAFKVARSIKKESKTVVSKIKRVMLFKFILGGTTLTFGVIMLIGSVIKPEQFRFWKPLFTLRDNQLMFICLTVFIALMLVFNGSAYKQIKVFGRKAIPIKESLTSIIAIMEKTIRLNIYFGSVFNAIAASWIYYAVVYHTKSFQWNREALWILFVACLAFGIFYFLGRYEQKLKFGRYVNQLKNCHFELEDENN